ncbi:MAG TPA: 30S ribosomal protein S6 [Vitreimonas sp.]|nr:30S ribosomal protein S6 [Vitreimonas sp.]
MKLVKDEVVRKYELTYLLPAVYTDAEMSKISEGVVTSLKKHKAEVVKNEPWGKKKLAYRLKHGGKMHTEAHYFHVVFNLPSLKAPELERDVYLQTEIMRHLLVVAEENGQAEPSKLAE